MVPTVENGSDRQQQHRRRRIGLSHPIAIVAAMANQSLYRRYRPRRFSEVKGQDHVVKALRNAVAEGREGQAYLFSGPRGTGKTTSARILAKVLNCENAVDGEPCCECESCIAVERGTSYDVHELDAASNNGVDAMRDLIEKASLGTPGRHKVYILDEVHMLSKPAEAALLKTLEEPPPHVVFVLATTDPQKMSDTIRSRTQHLQFHLLNPDTLSEHVRWVAADAGLDVSDAAVEQVLRQGAGSARDALSALELAATVGDAGLETGAARRVRRGDDRPRPGPGAHDGGARDQHRSRPADADRGTDRLHAQRVPVPDGARTRPGVRPAHRRVDRAGEPASVRPAWCAASNCSARRSATCATRPIRGCCSTSPPCSSPPTRWPPISARCWRDCTGSKSRWPAGVAAPRRGGDRTGVRDRRRRVLVRGGSGRAVLGGRGPRAARANAAPRPRLAVSPPPGAGEVRCRRRRREAADTPVDRRAVGTDGSSGSARHGPGGLRTGHVARRAPPTP